MHASLRFAILSFALLALPGIASGQQPAQSLEQLRVLVAPGDDLTVFHPSGATTRGKLSAITPQELILDVGGDARRLHQTDIRAIRRRGKDSIVNGMLIGAATGIALGSLNYLDNECRGDAGCAAGLALGTAVCAGAGGLIDGLIRPSQLIYEGAPTGATRFVRPASVSQGWRAAVQVSVRF
jgi:hypothetical protein